MAESEWQTYVDERLMADIIDPDNQLNDHTLTAAAILGHDGSIKAQSPGFPELKPEEVDEIMKEFDEPDYLASTGLFLGGKKYLPIQGEPKVMIRALKGTKGVCIMKTGQTLVFGLHDTDLVNAGQFKCSVLIQGLGDDLIRQGL